MQDNKTEKKNIGELAHVVEKLSWGGEVLCLNDGAIITAEDRAMIQALHSRNPKGVREHLRILTEKGSGNMMSSFYVGYGHKSIGDCGTVTLFIEGVSLLAAKAIQDSQLYNGQECSTRYIDFSVQPFFDPTNNEGKNLKKNIISEKLRTFYLDAFPKIVEDLQNKNPRKMIEKDGKKELENENVYIKAIKARAFDILRGFLPAGATTNLAWSTTLRQVADRLMLLRQHPLKEVQEIAEKIELAVQKMYPNSFVHKKYEDTEKFNKKWMTDKSGYFYNPKERINDSVKLLHDGISKKLLKNYLGILKNRKAKTEIPKPIAITGNSIFTFLLDFGSWRDIQRHRSVVQPMPLLTTDRGFENWYLENLPQSVRVNAEKLLKEIQKDIKKIKTSIFDRQYFTPIGFKVPVILSGDLPALAYVAEIRATSVVHTTLQKKAIQLGELLEKTYKIKIFIDKKDIGRFDSKRGKDDIVMKK